jgi:hypothetical protein
MPAEQLQLLPPGELPTTLKEIQAHFDAHPELWDKNHPDYGKGPRFVDYISLLPSKNPTPEERARNQQVCEELTRFARENNIQLAPITPARFCPDCARTSAQGVCDGCENTLFVPGPTAHLEPKK